jgi:hypothetical protein
VPDPIITIVDTLFNQLFHRAPDVLIDLQGREPSVRAARAWTVEHHLNGDPRIAASALELRKWWTDHPPRPGQVLRLLKRHHADAVYHHESEAERSCRAALLVDPDTDTLPRHGESLRQWLDRAREIYQILRPYAAVPDKQNPPRRKRETARHVAWFIDLQVRGIRPTELARREHVDRAAIDRATDRIAASLQIPRRRWPRGKAANT